MELLSKNQVQTNVYELEIKVDGNEFAEGMDYSFKKNAKNLSIHGFRKGKAPKSAVMKIVGEEYFFEDAINHTYGKAYDEAVKAAGLEPVAAPEIELKNVDKSGYVFTAKVANKPVLELGQYKGLEVTRPVISVTDEDVDKELDRRAERNSRLVEVTDRPAQIDDTAVIDYEGSVDGVPFDGGKDEDYSLVLGSATFIPGFEVQIIGHNIGETFDIDVTFPEDYHAEELKGKPAVFKVTLKALKVKEKPVIDDEFAKDVSEFDTLDEFKADLKAKMLKANEDYAKDQMENALVEKAANNSKVDVPDAMIDARLGEMLNELNYRLQMQGMDLDTYMSYTGMTREAFLESYRPQATTQVLGTLTLEKIAEVEGLTVSEEEIDKELAETAESYKMELERFKELSDLDKVKSQLLLTKAVKFLMDNAVITDAQPEENAAETAIEE